MKYQQPCLLIGFKITFLHALQWKIPHTAYEAYFLYNPYFLHIDIYPLIRKKYRAKMLHTRGLSQGLITWLFYFFPVLRSPEKKKPQGKDKCSFAARSNHYMNSRSTLYFMNSQSILYLLTVIWNRLNLVTLGLRRGPSELFKTSVRGRLSPLKRVLYLMISIMVRKTKKKHTCICIRAVNFDG